MQDVIFGRLPLERSLKRLRTKRCCGDSAKIGERNSLEGGMWGVEVNWIFRNSYQSRTNTHNPVLVHRN